MAEYQSDVLIIGSGPAGYTAGIYAARSGLTPIIVSGEQPGGQLMLSSELENYPGFPETIRGADLMESMRKQAENTGCQIIDDMITEVDFQHTPFTCMSQKNNVFTGKSVIVATGASAKWLNIESETKYRGWGVSVCATCDGFFYKNKRVAVVGGGNSAAEEALFLANIASNVLLIHRRDSLRADKVLQDRVFSNPRINVVWNSVIEEILGKENPLGVTGIKLKNITNDTITTVNLDGVFIAIGHQPNTSVFTNQLTLDSQGYIMTYPEKSCITSCKGVFAAGDVVSGNYKQAVIAAASGCMAFLEAEKYLAQFK